MSKKLQCVTLKIITILTKICFFQEFIHLASVFVLLSLCS